MNELIGQQLLLRENRMEETKYLGTYQKVMKASHGKRFCKGEFLY